MHSPLKDPRTRYPGQSLSEQVNDITETLREELLSPFLFFLLAMVSWIYYYTPTKPNPWIYTIFFLIATWVCIRRVRPLFKRRRNLEKGMVGEQILGKFLEEHLMPSNYTIIHDLICKNGEKTFNVDHVVVGPTGVFSIETKYWKKPDGPNHQIFYDGKKILVDGYAPDNDPLVEAIAGARTVASILESRTGKHFDVKPIVVFLGWYTTKNPKDAPAWVLNEQAVPTFIKNDFRELPYDDATLAIAQLKLYSEECGKK